MITSSRAFLSALAALLIGIAWLPSLASAQSQVPNPVLRPQKATNPNAKLPVPEATAIAKTDAPIVVAGDFTHGRVIVLRGLANVFSRGMDKLANSALAEAPRVYCFADGPVGGGKLGRYLGWKGVLYVTPIFKSAESIDLLTSVYRRSIPEAGFTVCVSESDEPDIEEGRQRFVDAATAEGQRVEVVPFPTE